MSVFITGTSKGLGYALAKELSSKMNVIGCARGSCDLNIKHFSGIDLSIPQSLSSIESELDDADALINNVGVAFDGLLAVQSEESIHHTIQVNLITPIILTKKYVRRRLCLKKPGVIINISSIVGIRGYAGLAVYSATKAALDGMTRSLARELGPKGFRINSVLPGYMETDLSASLGDSQKAQIVRRTPLGRLARVEDVVPVVKFLLSDEASFITGQSIVVDGGITV